MSASVLSDGQYEALDSSPLFVRSLPEGELRIVDAKGQIGIAHKATVNGQIMLYGEPSWLAEAKFPIRYESLPRLDDAFCFA